MASRSKYSQTKHDKKVKSLAQNLESQGFSVKADLPDYEKPKTIGGVRPDIIATNGKKRRIYEVETAKTVDSARDQNQQKEFKKAADRSKNTTFKRFMAR